MRTRAFRGLRRREISTAEELLPHISNTGYISFPHNLLAIAKYTGESANRLFLVPANVDGVNVFSLTGKIAIGDTKIDAQRFLGWHTPSDYTSESPASYFTEIRPSETFALSRIVTQSFVIPEALYPDQLSPEATRLLAARCIVDGNFEQSIRLAV